MAWWREARFGMFIHWGLYAAPAGVWEGQPVPGLGEWLMHKARVPVADYAALAGRFQPDGFDAAAWVHAAREAGMKYIVITAKHHDGFAMFRSKASPFNIHDATPFRRDPLKELAAECQKQGMKLGFFYSQAQDWHHAGGATFGEHWDKAQDGDMTAYLQAVAVPQVKELLTNYGPVAVLWWDTPKGMTKERAELLLPALKLQPQIITNSRLGGEVPGDYRVAEQQILQGKGTAGDWETCATMNKTWGYKQADNHWKPATVLVRDIITCASRGGNYLLNIGPDGQGVMPAASLERLKVIGTWMQTNGEAIYGTTASPFASVPFDGTATQKAGRIYLHVFGRWSWKGPSNSWCRRSRPRAEPWRHPLRVSSAGRGLRRPAFVHRDFRELGAVAEGKGGGAGRVGAERAAGVEVCGARRGEVSDVCVLGTEATKGRRRDGAQGAWGVAVGGGDGG